MGPGYSECRLACGCRIAETVGGKPCCVSANLYSPHFCSLDCVSALAFLAFIGGSLIAWSDMQRLLSSYVDELGRPRRACVALAAKLASGLSGLTPVSVACMARLWR